MGLAVDGDLEVTSPRTCAVADGDLRGDDLPAHRCAGGQGKGPPAGSHGAELLDLSAHLDVSKVTIDRGGVARFSRPRGKLAVTLAEPLEPGTEFTLTIR